METDKLNDDTKTCNGEIQFTMVEIGDVNNRGGVRPTATSADVKKSG